MLIRQLDVTLDVYAIKPLITNIHCKQSEHESNQFNIRLRNGDTDYIIDQVNDKFQILFHKADGNVVESPVDTFVGTSILSYTCQGNELAFAGKVEIEVRLYREDNGGNVTELLVFPKIIVTCDTIVDVTNAIASTSQFDTLTALIDEVNDHMYTAIEIDDVTPATDKLYSSSRVEERISDVQDAIDACYTSVETDNLLDDKADVATTYTKTEVDTSLGLKANSADVYTKTATDNLLNDKANQATTYTKTEVDNIAGTKVDKVTGKGLSTEDYSSAEKTKLSGISTGATKTEASLTNGNIKIDSTETTVYTHPASHDATMINQDSTHRFVTDIEKSDWNSKLAGADVVVGGTATKVTYNNKGQVTAGATLADTDIPNLDAAKITTGTFDIARIPAAALERLTQVADQTARYALTTAVVQLGDTVKQLDTGLMYVVVDTANLGNANGYVAYTAATAAAVPWSGVTSKPTTISGYGITDAYTKTEVDNTKVAKTGDTMTGNLILPSYSVGDLNHTIKKLGDTAWTNGIANEKIDIELGSGTFYGQIVVRVWCNFGNVNANGMLEKRIDVIISSIGTINWQQGNYTYVGTKTNDMIAISDVVWDSTKSKYVIKVCKLTTANSNSSIELEVFRSTGSTLVPTNTILSSIYTTDTTVYPTAVLQTEGKEIATVPYVSASGGNNLLKNSAWMKDTTGWVLDIGWSRDIVNILDNTAESVTVNRTGLGSDAALNVYTGNNATNYPIPVKQGDILTFSIWVKSPNYSGIDSTGLVLYLRELNSSYAFVADSSNKAITPTADNTWQRFSFTYTVTGASASYIQPVCKIYRNGTVYITKPQLERGYYATDWQPSIADLTDGTQSSAGSMLQTAKVCTLANGNITLSGLQTIDGYTTVANDRILVSSQTNAVENGLYYASSGSWIRTNDTLTANTVVNVEKGTAWADSTFTLSSDLPITVGVSSLIFALIGRPQLAAAATAYTSVMRDGSGDILGRVLKSNVGNGTAPLSITSTTMVPNLNADSVDGLQGSDLMKFVNGNQIRVYTQLNAEASSNITPIGTVKVTLPKSWSDTTITIGIKGFAANGIGGISLILAGFNLVSGSWSQSCSASSQSYLPFTSVRFGHDGSKCCILLGNTTTSWTYQKLYIDFVMVGFNNFTTGWDTGWSISTITDETGITVSQTPTINAGVPINITTTGQAISNNNVQIQTKDSGGTAKNIAYMTTGNLMVYGASANATQINGTTLEHFNGSTTLKVVTVVTGTAPPAVTPNFVGQVFVDTTNKKTYRAYGTSTSADWGYEGLKVISENSTASAGQSTITISTSGFSTVTDAVRVFINGIKLRPTAAFTVSGSTITLLNNYTLGAGDEIELEVIKNGA